MALNKHTSLTLLFLLSISFGQEYSVTSLLDKDGEVYDLTQKMSINMQDSDIKNVLMLIGELTDLNIVVSPAVKDTITANLENVSVKAALDVILKPNGYSYFTQENIVIVKGVDDKIVRELETVVIKLKYISSGDLTEPLSAVLSEQKDMIEEVIEPYLLQRGLIQRSSRGRFVSASGWRHLGLEPPKNAEEQSDMMSMKEK